jgi:hypothetical protein
LFDNAALLGWNIEREKKARTCDFESDVERLADAVIADAQLMKDADAVIADAERTQ